jgi:prephenate dehydrogenase
MWRRPAGLRRFSFCMTSLEDTRLAVFGPGLLGGSLLHDARALGARELRVWARRGASLEAVRQAGLADFVSTSAAAVADGADLLVLCVPVGAMTELARELAHARAAAGAVFTDVGSVKGMVMRTVAPVFAAAGLTFIGSHPMAGSERTGFAEARAGLYRDAACILTPPPHSPPAALARLHGFWQALGCRTSEMDAETHDAVVARVSHLPHAAAVLTALAAMQPEPGQARFAAGGLRDTTRVAAGDPAMWREILMENRAALLPALRDLLRNAENFTAAVESGDAAQVQSLLEEARRLRATRWP